MFNQNGNQLKNYGMELQNMGIKMQNFGMQLQNMMGNIGNEIQNMGIQISNIGIQIFNIGVQILNQNLNMPNMIEQNQFLGNFMNQNMNMPNQIQQIGINNNVNDTNKLKLNFIFVTQKGFKTMITSDIDITFEDLLKLYINKVGLDYSYVENEDIYFLFNGQKMKVHDKTKVKHSIYKYNGTHQIYVFNSKNLI